MNNLNEYITLPVHNLFLLKVCLMLLEECKQIANVLIMYGSLKVLIFHLY